LNDLSGISTPTKPICAQNTELNGKVRKQSSFDQYDPSGRNDCSMERKKEEREFHKQMLNSTFRWLVLLLFFNPFQAKSEDLTAQVK